MPSSYPLHQLRPPFCSTILNGNETSVPPVPPLHHHHHYPDQNKIDLCGRGTLGKFRLLCGKVFIPFFPLFFFFFPLFTWWGNWTLSLFLGFIIHYFYLFCCFVWFLCFFFFKIFYYKNHCGIWYINSKNSKNSHLLPVIKGYK